MIVVESKRKKPETLRNLYSGAKFADVTSSSDIPEYRRLSPFFPHNGIPIPFTDGMTATCVEAIWQGLKVFEKADVDINMFRNNTMKNIKRTVRRFGPPLGHRKGVYGKELLGYIDARKQIYIPSYKWMLEHCCSDLIERLRTASNNSTIVLLDYDTNSDVENPRKPLSHASLIKAYIEEIYPYGDAVENAVEGDLGDGQLCLNFN